MGGCAPAGLYLSSIPAQVCISLLPQHIPSATSGLLQPCLTRQILCITKLGLRGENKGKQWQWCQKQLAEAKYMGFLLPPISLLHSSFVLLFLCLNTYKTKMSKRKIFSFLLPRFSGVFSFLPSPLSARLHMVKLGFAEHWPCNVSAFREAEGNSYPRYCVNVHIVFSGKTSLKLIRTE